MTLFLFLFSLPRQFVYLLDFFSGWDFPVTFPQLEGEWSFSLLSNFGVFHFPKLFPHAIYSWWYGSRLVLFPSVEKEICNYKSLSFLLLNVISFLLSANSNLKFTTVFPFTIFQSYPLYLVSPDKTLFWTSPVLSINISSHVSSVFVWLATSVLLKPSCLLCAYVLFQLPLVSFVRILPYVQNTHVHFLARASICCLPGVLSWCHGFLYSLQCVGNSLHPFLSLLLSWCCFLQCSLYLKHPPPVVLFLNQPPGSGKSETT